MTDRNKIIDYIRKNRVSTTEVADALGKSGVLGKVAPITNDHHVVGRIRCIFTAHHSNHDLHEQVRKVKEGEIAMIFTHDCEEHAVIGELISKFLLMYRGAAAVVVDGWVRDASALRRERYRVWSRGATPLGCFNTPALPFPKERKEELLAMYEGGVAVCDDGGVTMLKKDQLNSEIYARLERIELQEDVWFYCLDVLKWDTHQIVCAKEYLQHPELMPEAFKIHMDSLSKALDKVAA